MKNFFKFKVFVTLLIITIFFTNIAIIEAQNSANNSKCANIPNLITSSGLDPVTNLPSKDYIVLNNNENNVGFSWENKYFGDYNGSSPHFEDDPEGKIWYTTSSVYEVNGVEYVDLCGIPFALSNPDITNGINFIVNKSILPVKQFKNIKENIVILKKEDIKPGMKARAQTYKRVVRKLMIYPN